MKRLLLASAAILIAGTAAVIVAAMALNPDRLRDDFKDAVARATGRELTIAGPIKIHFGLAPRLDINDVALANPPGAARPYILTAKSLTAQLALFPLLAGDAVISSLTLDEPDIALQRAADGTGNWQFSPARHALYQGHGGAGSGGNGHSVQIQTLHVRGGRIAWQPPQGAPITASLKALDWSADGIDSPMTLALEAVRHDVTIDVTATSGSLQRLQGGPVSALAGTWPLTIDVATLGAGIHIEGGVNHPEQQRGYNLRLTLNAKDFAALTPLLGVGALPPLADVNATAVLQDGSDGALRTSQISVHAGASDLGSWASGLAVRQLLFSAPGPGQLVQLSIDGTYQAQPLSFAATGTQPDVVGAGGPIEVTLSAQAAGAHATAHGTIPPSVNAPGLDLTLNAKAPDLSTLSPLIGLTLPPAQDFALSARINDPGVKLRGIAVRDLAITSSLGDAAGDLTMMWTPRASLVGTLTSQTLNLDAITGGGTTSLIPAIWPASTDPGVVQPIAPPPPAPPTMPATPAPDNSQNLNLPLARLRATDADLALTIGDLTLAGQKFEDFQAHLHLTDGKLALNPFRAQSPQGAIIGGVSLDASSDTPPIAITLRSPAISADALANLAGTPGGAHGTMQIDAQLSATGQTTQALRSTLNGHLGLAMVNGQIEDTLVQTLLGTVLDTAGIPTVGTGTNQVRCFASRLDFTQGTGTIRALALDTSKLALDGTGTINLADQTADLHIRPRVRLGPTQIAAPVSLSGPIGALKATLDPVLDGNRVGITIGGPQPAISACAPQLATARGGMSGPMPAIAPPPDQGFSARKPKDLLQGLFH